MIQDWESESIYEVAIKSYWMKVPYIFLLIEEEEEEEEDLVS
jgi:hypothetical protein